MAGRVEYPFESKGGHYRDREGELAKTMRTAFLNHIGIEPKAYEDWPAELKGLIGDFVAHTLLNIDWYQEKAKRQHKAKIALDVLMTCIVGFVFLTWNRNSTDTAGSLAASVTAALAMLKFVSEAHDFQKYRSNYWQAAANLKTRLYLFEADCLKGPRPSEGNSNPAALLKDGKPTGDFVERLRLEVNEALKICDVQQDEYYKLLSEPSALLSSASTAVSSLKAARTELEAVRDKQLEREKDHRKAPYREEIRRIKQECVRVAERAVVLRSKTNRTAEEDKELESFDNLLKALEAQEQRIEALMNTLYEAVT